MTKVMRYENGKAIAGQVDAPFKVDWSDWINMTDAQKKGKKWLIENVPGAEGEIDAELFTPLWTNPSPAAAFAGQQITLASGDYDFLLVIGYHDISSSLRQVNSIIEKGESGFLEEATQNYSRTITYISEKVLSIGNGYVGNTANNNVCVLTAIYGFKKTVKIKFDALAKDVSTLASKCMLSENVSVADALTGFDLIADGVTTYQSVDLTKYSELIVLLWLGGGQTCVSSNIPIIIGRNLRVSFGDQTYATIGMASTGVSVSIVYGSYANSTVSIYGRKK